MENNDELLVIEPKILRAANAGNYKPFLTGYVKSLLYWTPMTKLEGLAGFNVELVDISFYQRTAVFPTMMSKGIKGAIIRAGQNVWKDEQAETFMTDAEKAGLPIGSYWFYDSRVSPNKQAALWKEVLANHKTPLYCWADYEETYGGPYGGWRNFYDFLELCKIEMPDRKFGIYTGYYYWIEHSPNPLTQAGSLNYFAKYPLWLAWYAPDISYVKIPKPWTKMTLWQKTAKGDGKELGVGSLNIDMDEFIGTEQEFKEFFQLETTGGEMPTVNWKGFVLSGPAIVRSTPNGTDTGQRLLAGQQVEAQGELVAAGNYNWRNVVSPVTGWVADHLLQGDYITPPATESHIIEVYIDGVLEFRKEF